MADARARARAGSRPRAHEATIITAASLTDPVSLGLTALAAGLGLAMVWVQWPRPPQLDGERWFKTLLVALVRGRIEAEHDDVEAFEAAVVRFVPYHPAGRYPERKVTRPEWMPTDAALDGEHALLEALAALPTVQARWARLYDEDEVALDARLSDPHDLGPTYDPASVLVPDAGWDAVAAWGADPAKSEAAPLKAALARALPARWGLVSGRPQPGAPSMLDALAAELPDRTTRIDGTSGPEAVLDALRTLAYEASDGLVLVGEGSGVTWVMQALFTDPEVRERTLAVVSLGGVIGGRTDVTDGPLSEAARTDWLQAHFRARDLETEVVRITPYFSVQWLDRSLREPGLPGLPLAAQRFVEPDATGASAITLETVDLGPLFADPELPVALVARALVVCATAWLAHHR